MIGIDLVFIPRFERSVAGPIGTALLDRMFSPAELDQCRKSDGSFRMESLAGRFAIKEAVIKASRGELNLSDLGLIRIEQEESGFLRVEVAKNGVSCRHYDVSLSHDHEYATAVAIRAERLSE